MFSVEVVVDGVQTAKTSDIRIQNSDFRNT